MIKTKKIPLFQSVYKINKILTHGTKRKILKILSGLKLILMILS
jgi:hypothetical protein